MPRRHPKPSRPGGRGRGAAPGPRLDPARDAERAARERAVCASKARYATQAEARSFALMHNPGGAGPRVSTYRCTICDGWHFTRG